jgi:hypothetical protein
MMIGRYLTPGETVHPPQWGPRRQSSGEP